MGDHHDRDPLRAAFDDYQRAPRDVVPHTTKPVLDLAALDGQTVPVTWHDFDEHGITTHHSHIAITRPIGAPEND